jgi:hypothetical protein
MRRSLLILALMIPFVARAGSVGTGGEDTIKKSFNVRSGGTLYLDIDRGNVEIETSDDEMVHVVMERNFKGRKESGIKALLENHEWTIDQDGNDIVVESRYRDEDEGWSFRRHRNRNSFRLKITIILPHEYNIDFQTGAGNVGIDDLDGEIVGTTGAGNLTIGDVGGPVDLTSGSGNIDVSSIQGSISVRSGAGNIDIGEIFGRIVASTGAGDIIATLSEQPDRDSELRSGAGNVTVYLSDDIAVDVDASASVGSADSDFGLRVRGKWMSKSFSGRVNGGGPALSLHTGVGNVSLKRN